MSVFDIHITDVLERNRISRELIALYTHRTLTQAGVAVAGVFTVVFVYRYFGDSLAAVLCTFGAIYIGTALATPMSARFLGTLGTRRMLILALPCMAAGALVLYAIDANGSVWGLPPAASMAFFILCVVAFKTLYWVPYHVNISELLDRAHRGIQLAFLENAAEVNVAAMPFWGGLIIALFGFDALYMFAALLLLIAALPLAWVTNRYEQFSWSYAETFTQLRARRNRPILIAYVSDGIQSGAQLVVWPLLVFLLLDGEFVALGAVAALTLFAILILRFITGRFLDRGRTQQTLAWGAFIMSSGWVLRLFAGSPITVVAIDTYHGLGQVVNRLSVEAISYEQAADNGRFVDEFTVFKEIALHCGRAITLLFVGIMAWWGGAYVGFMAGLILAAAAALGTMRLTRAVSLV